MKSKEELKAALHQLIDGIDDESLLNLLMGDIVPYVIAFRAGEPAKPENADNESSNISSATRGHIDEINAADWEKFKFNEDRRPTNN